MDPNDLIEPYYYDYWGNRVETSESTRRAIIASFDTHAARAAQDDTKSARSFDTSSAVPPVIVVREGERPELPFHPYCVELEDGSSFEGDLAALPLGYHTLRDRQGSATCSLIVAPSQCYLPPQLRDGRVWALATQLYALASERNWGIGDFTDLAEFARIAGRAGARAIGLNPLHALHPHNPTAPSPYSPSSRLFLNVLYIDVERIPEFDESNEARSQVEYDPFVYGLENIRSEEFVDYLSVSGAKFFILEELYDVFVDRHLARNDSRARAFKKFVREGGPSLERLAIYEALAEHFWSRNSASHGWREWPTEYRSPASPEVARFAREHRRKVEFFLYLQWIAEGQLRAAAADARRAKVSLYLDLAVGADLNGADVWADQDAFAVDASLGAPPDPLNTQGQNWGLAPFSPLTLRERAYRPFIGLLRANMRHAGILRVDHVMALRRAFWIPQGKPATRGAYVRYPMEDLLGIVALESLRNRCAVVGEDLGTVPDGFRASLADTRALSTRLFYFERDWSNGSFLAPDRYPQLAAASVGTHDLPTLAGWWTGDRSAQEDRWRDRFLLIDALERTGAIDATGAARLREDAARGGTPAVVPKLADAVHRFLGRTPCALVVVAIEDVLHEAGSVNVPGTFDEYPNWRRKRSRLLQDIETDVSRTGRLLAR